MQAVIALLASLDDETWSSVQVEPNEALQKVDILWHRDDGTRVVQVKSSINQIGKADAERWASDLFTATAADQYQLVLVGPCSQSVVEMGSFQVVEVPCPKNLDIEGLLREAAHNLDKFLEQVGLDRKSPIQRELMVNALTKHLSTLSSNGKAMSRSDLVELIKKWVGSITGSVTSAWEVVTFEPQRGIENAVAGKRLGPSDTDACPEFPICDDIAAELNRSHFYEVVGTPGCGKSITAWHVAKRYRSLGFSVWRPRATANAEDLISSLPRSRALLVVDDAHLFGGPFAMRMSEVSGPETKVLLVSTVEQASQASVICISPKRCVERLAMVLLPQREEVLPIIHRFDDRVGNRYGDTKFEERVRQAQRESTPWMFFWVLRGGWRTARREFESLSQFANAADVLLFIAAGQIASCDAGVSYEWLLSHAQNAGIDNGSLDKALGHLRRLGLVLHQDALRTKHITYAHRIAEECFGQGNRDTCSRLSQFIVKSVLADGWSLKGVSWLLDAVRYTDAFRWHQNATFQKLVEPLVLRCSGERDDIDWAAGCLMRVFRAFEITTDEILEYSELLLDWVTSHCGLVSYFCHDIVNELINRSDSITGSPARQFIDSVDAVRLADLANSVGISEFYRFGELLNRLAYYGPSWRSEFVERFDWSRVQKLILDAPANYASGVDSFVTGLSLLARPSDANGGLDFIEGIVPYVTSAINSRPAETIEAMHGVFWTCLGFYPKFLRGGAGPQEDQIRVAKQITANLDPQVFARALEEATSRALEQLARAFEVLSEIEPKFIGDVVDCLSQEHFFAATQDDWVNQSSELDHILRFFCGGEDLQPAAEWVRKNQHLIAGPLRTIFVCIAPEVAIEFHKAGRAIELADDHSHWQERAFAIGRLAKRDEPIAVEIVEQQLGSLIDEIHKLTLDEPQYVIRFFRVLFELSERLFDRFVSAIDLDNPIALKTIAQLSKNQPKERRHYQQVARCGCRMPGRISELSSELLRRLEDAPNVSQCTSETAPPVSDCRLQ